jgi:hypothetical protein
MCQAGLESRCVWLSLTGAVSELFRQLCVTFQAVLDSRSVRVSDIVVSCIRLGFTARVSETQRALCYVSGWA